MIEVIAKLQNLSYFVGEKISCTVTFKNVNHPSDQQMDERVLASVSNDRHVETLGWASGQIVCICSINPQKMMEASVIPHTQRPNSTTVTTTSLSPSRGENGFVIFSTKPKILVCDLALIEGQSKEFIYEENLQSDLPPSFRGQAVKYSYKLKIGLQRVGFPVKMLHLALRFITWQSLGLSDFHDEEEIAVTNPFLKLNPKDSILDQALEAVQQLSARRTPSVFKVTNSQGKVVSLCLFKTSYRLGEDIVGTLDFGDAAVSCMQYSVTLQSLEIIPAEKRRRLGNQNAFGEETIVTSHSKHHEFSVGFIQTHLTLPVPLHVTPSFQTEIVTLKWRLHFEFVTAIKPINWCGDSEWLPPKAIDIETLICDFPIVIYPTAPAHVSKSLHGQRDGKILL